MVQICKEYHSSTLKELLRQVEGETCHVVVSTPRGDFDWDVDQAHEPDIGDYVHLTVEDDEDVVRFIASKLGWRVYSNNDDETRPWAKRKP